MRNPALAILALALLPLACRAPSAGPAPAGAVFAFDAEPAGPLPPGWRVDATRSGVGGPGGGLATWGVVEDGTAPSGTQVMAVTSARHGEQDTFNLCWTDGVRFRDGRLRVAVQAVAGEVDQGGGPMWRVQGRDDYYLCRVNPLERNVRVYRVSGGVRRQLASAPAEVAPGSWHVIEVEVDGERIRCTLDGSISLEARDLDGPREGGVGLWTKADAVTRFDDLRVDGR